MSVSCISVADYARCCWQESRVPQVVRRCRWPRSCPTARPCGGGVGGPASTSQFAPPGCGLGGDTQQVRQDRYLGGFAGLDNPTSSAHTRELLGWHPAGTGPARGPGRRPLLRRAAVSDGEVWSWARPAAAAGPSPQPWQAGVSTVLVGTRPGWRQSRPAAAGQSSPDRSRRRPPRSAGNGPTGRSGRAGCAPATPRTSPSPPPPSSPPDSPPAKAAPARTPPPPPSAPASPSTQAGHSSWTEPQLDPHSRFSALLGIGWLPAAHPANDSAADPPSTVAALWIAVF